MLKKLSIVVGLSMANLIAFAGTSGNEIVIPTGTPLIAPESEGVWSVGLEALYLNSNTPAYQYANTGPITSGTVDNETVSAGWGWGGEVDVTYLFPHSSTDLSASYMYVGQDNSDTLTSDGTRTSFVGGIFFAAPFSSMTGSVDQTLNAATLTIGQWFNINRLALHPFIGLAFSDIDLDGQSTGYNIFDPAVADGTNSGHTDFTGVGPRAGINGAFNLGKGFTLVGTFAGDLLVGSSSTEFPYVQYTGTPSSGELDTENYTSIVPELDAKLGLGYLHNFNLKTSLNIEAGYQVINYFNAVHFNALSAFFTNSINEASDVNYNGPYARLQLNFA